MKNIKTSASSQNKFVNKNEIISHLADYNVNLENVKFNIVENHQEAYGCRQYQVIEIPDIFYNLNEISISNYLKHK